jgi:hypothetical protein
MKLLRSRTVQHIAVLIALYGLSAIALSIGG